MATVSGVYVNPTSVGSTLGSTLFIVVSGALILIAGLSWSSFFNSLFETYFPKNNALLAKFIYALILTIIIGLVVLILARLLRQGR